jgi:hypothetical protein
VRVSRQKLIDLALREVEERANSDHLLSAYLIGSVTTGAPILGGTADVDLVFIHDSDVPFEREFVPLSSDFHLDIVHHASELYNRPTELRVDPWLGPTMCEPMFLYDPLHFFERAQAGVRGQFHRADFVHQRASAFLEQSREMSHSLEDDWIKMYTQVLLEAANALVTLAGFPVAGRRLSMILEARLSEMDFESFHSRFLAMLGADELKPEQLDVWIANWQAVIDAASAYDERFLEVRSKYHRMGFQSLIEEGYPQAILWNLIRTWNSAIRALAFTGNEEQFRQPWKEFLGALKLDRSHREKRSTDLEQYLDDIEGVIEVKAGAYGA